MLRERYVNFSADMARDTEAIDRRHLRDSWDGYWRRFLQPGAVYAMIDQLADDEDLGDTWGTCNALTEIGLKCYAGTRA